MPITSEPFDVTPSGEPVRRYMLSAGAVRVSILSYGGIVQAIEVPDRDGAVENVALGFATLDDYLNRSPYFGCITGRFANRIADGRFTLDGQEYQIPCNDGANALHGGPAGLDKQLWDVAEVRNDDDEVRLRLRYVSKDGDQGFPGTVTMSVDYALTADGSLVIDYQADTDAATVVNLTNHSYFNLAGEGNGDVYSHQVAIYADHYNPVDAGLIPTGEIAPVTGTPLDFTSPTPIGVRLQQPHEQLLLGRGIDHNYVLRGADRTLRPAAHVVEPRSGRTLDVLTTEPGLQFYTGNLLDGTLSGPSGRVYGQGAGFAMETQHFPDSPNHPDFPSTVLRPGQTLRSTTVYTFSVTAQ